MKNVSNVYGVQWIHASVHPELQQKTLSQAELCPDISILHGPLEYDEESNVFPLSSNPVHHVSHEIG
jgi:hypothetical protein